MSDRLPEEQYQAIKAKGYTLAREQFPFGRCEMYKNHNTGHCLYFYDGKLREWGECQALLRESWRPLTWEDQAWMRNNVGSAP